MTDINTNSPNILIKALKDQSHIDKDYEKISRFYAPFEWPAIKKKIEHINHLKKIKNATILGHNYMTADIYNLVSDFRGDSLALAKKACEIDNDIIIQAGVYFMAETTKILNMDKKVLIPDPNAGCSLASSITAENVRDIKAKYPNAKVICYVNTNADVKAEVDICVTSSNAYDIVNQIEEDQVIFLPDKYLAENVAAYTKKQIITWDGSCIVHEEFTKDDINLIKKQYQDIKIIAHPECKKEVVEMADFSGSTFKMSEYVKNHKPENVALITECSMSDNVACENPEVNFVKPCNLCPYMKKITLDNIIQALEEEKFEILIKDEIAKKAVKAIKNMLDMSNMKKSTLIENNQPNFIIENPTTVKI